jgi:soluble lytic murein transglycosylase-like protein
MSRGKARKTTAVGGGFALAAAVCMPCAGAVYVSESSGPVPHFASHPSDASFRLLIRDEIPAGEARLPAVRANPAQQKRRAQLEPLIERVAVRQQVEPSLVRAVIEVESQFHAQALSPKGALGAMQLMPQTARRYGVADRRDPAQNIEGGVAYLKDLLARFQGNVALALAAYNAGEHAVDRHGHVIPRYRETMLYVPRVLEAYMRYRAAEARP